MKLFKGVLVIRILLYLEDLNGEHKLPEIVNFLQFRSGGSWIGFLTVFTSFFFATELQMYVSNVFAILFISIPIEMVME